MLLLKYLLDRFSCSTGEVAILPISLIFARNCNLMYAIHRQAAAPSGVAFSLSARLTPSCLQSTSSSRAKIVRNLITATNDFLQLFEVVEEVVSSVEFAVGALPNGIEAGAVENAQADGEQSEESHPAGPNGHTQVS